MELNSLVFPSPASSYTCDSSSDNFLKHLIYIFREGQLEPVSRKTRYNKADSIKTKDIKVLEKEGYEVKVEVTEYYEEGDVYIASEEDEVAPSQLFSGIASDQATTPSIPGTPMNKLKVPDITGM